MRFLIIGGTQLSGPFLIRNLASEGHHVTIYHRGNHSHNVPPGAEQIIARARSGLPQTGFTFTPSPKSSGALDQT